MRLVYVPIWFRASLEIEKVSCWKLTSVYVTLENEAEKLLEGAINGQGRIAKSVNINLVLKSPPENIQLL